MAPLDPERMSPVPVGSVPVPDPTVLTTAALLREISALRELFDQRIEAQKELLLAAVASETKLTDERFKASEERRIEQKVDTKAAVESALVSQKDAVREQTAASDRAIAKSEMAMTKQIEQQQVTFATTVEALRNSIAELKDRAAEDSRLLRSAISDVATTANGTVQQKVGAKEDRTGLYATVGITITVALAIMTLVAFLATRIP